MMPQIMAWQCPQTKKVFADKADYQKHIRALARKRYEKRTFDAYKLSSTQQIRDTLNTMPSLDDIRDWFLDAENARFLLKRLIRTKINAYRTSRLKPKQIADFEFIRFEFKNMRWSDECSNSHCRPRDGVRNWCGRDKEAPTDYPGFHGRLCWKTNETELWQDIFADTGVLTGGGGGSGNGYEHEVTLFASDWANLGVFYKLSQ